METMTRGGFARAGTSIRFNTGSWRSSRPEHRPQVAPCAFACPAGENPQAYLAKVANGELRAAWEMLVRTNPLPAITGRVCHHPCESHCNRGAYDEAIAIHGVERFLGERAIAEGWSYPVAKPAADAPEIAIVGAGPAGLSCAYHLASLACKPTIFEAQPQPGGLLRSALPPYRLPGNVLDAELERLLSVGIALRPNVRIGRDTSVEELRADFRAVFLAPGNNYPRQWSLDGFQSADLRSAISLLKEWISIGATPTGERVAIIGGGNTAIDLARVMKFGGAAEVHVITFQALPGPGIGPAEAMSATPREIRQAIEEGVTVHERRGVRRLIMHGDSVVGVEIVHMRELEGADGRRRPIAFEGTETVLKVDQVIPAIGQVVEPSGFERLLDGSAFFTTDSSGALAGHPGIFAGGDARGSGATVSAAIGDGRRVALTIRAWMEGSNPPQLESSRPIGLSALNLNYFTHTARAGIAVRAPEERSPQEEIEASLSHAGLTHEARRCFSCGECMACDNCWTLCPDNSVLKTRSTAEGRGDYVFDYDHCKGCGICAHECPVGFIAMCEEP